MDASNLTEDQEYLALLMSNISYEARSSSWERYNEYYIWKIITEKIIKDGSYEIDFRIKKRLIRLSKKIGGWICYGKDGVEFVPIDKWLEMYNLFVRK